MPLFYFDIDDGQMSADLSGQDLPDLDAARAKALDLANVALASSLGAWHDRRWALDVYDMMGLPLFKIATDVHTGLRIRDQRLVSKAPYNRSLAAIVAAPQKGSFVGLGMSSARNGRHWDFAVRQLSGSPARIVVDRQAATCPNRDDIAGIS